MSYEDLLKKGKKQIKEPKNKKDRFSYPDPETFKEGKTTILKNFGEICKALNREKKYLQKFLSQNLGTAGKTKKNRLIFQGHFSNKELKEELEEFVQEYIFCPKCGSPDTKPVIKRYSFEIKCEACGEKTTKETF